MCLTPTDASATSLADRERAALRTIAGLVAGGAASTEVFAAIAREAGRVTGSAMAQIRRFERDDRVTVVGSWGVACECAAVVPIVVDGEAWGAIVAGPSAGGPATLDFRLAEFTELVTMAISSTARRETLTQLAEEQAALRRVATLVAREEPAGHVFARVAEEVGGVLGVEDTRIVRYDADGMLTVVASWGRVADGIPPGTRWPATESVSTLVLRTGRPARKDNYDGASGRIGDDLGRAGIRSAVGCPILVDGKLWGAMLAASLTAEPLPAETEARISRFTELVATAISNIDARSEFRASRARLVAAGVEERRRVVGISTTARGLGKRVDAAQVVVLEITRQVAGVGTREPAGQLGRAHPARQLEQRERIAACLGHDAVTDALVQRPRDDRCQQGAGVVVIEPCKVQLRQGGEIGTRLADGEDERHPLSHQPPGDEPEHLPRGAVEPLHVVDDAEKRAVVRGREQAECRQRDEEAVRRLAGLETECDAQSRPLMLGDGVEPVEQRSAELVQARERQLHLGLDALDLRDAEPGRLPRRIPQQCGLADARLTADHERSAATAARAVEQPVQRVALVDSPAEPGPGHRPTDGNRRIRCRPYGLGSGTVPKRQRNTSTGTRPRLR